MCSFLAGLLHDILLSMCEPLPSNGQDNPKTSLGQDKKGMRTVTENSKRYAPTAVMPFTQGCESVCVRCACIIAAKEANITMHLDGKTRSAQCGGAASRRRLQPVVHPQPTKRRAATRMQHYRDNRLTPGCAASTGMPMWHSKHIRSTHSQTSVKRQSNIDAQHVSAPAGCAPASHPARTPGSLLLHPSQ